MSRFVPKRGVLGACLEAWRRDRADRIRRIRARLADAGRHMELDQRLWEIERGLRRQGENHAGI